MAVVRGSDGRASAGAVAPGTRPFSDQADTFGAWPAICDLPAWAISLAVHVAVLLILASVTIVTVIEQQLALSAVVPPEEIRQEEFVVDTESEVIGSKSDLNIIGPSLAAAQHRGLDNHREEVRRLDDQIINPEIPDLEELPTPNEARALDSIDLTGTTEFAGGTDGAIDRITQEIAASLRQRKTLVVWLFDESGSLQKRREQVAQRFENIYRQLGLLKVDRGEALLSGVVGYGQEVHLLQKEPTNDVDLLVQAVKSIKQDNTGIERVFAGISVALKTFLPEKRRMRANMMLIVVTDERGDDFQMLEDVVRRCAREGVRTYCVGNTSIFGRQKGYVQHQWEFEGERFDEEIEIDQGPETVLAEGLQLPFWASQAQGLEKMSSGYGPYTLARLCSETGGIFFVADDSSGRTFDPTVMRRYAPDYRPIADYQKQLTTNDAKAALVAAAQRQVESQVPVPQFVFRAENDNILRQQITEAQKPWAEFDYFLQPIQLALEQGEKQRNKLDSDRWRASFDLAMGRVLAMRVRVLGYNTVLADMKTSPRSFQNPGSNLWRLEPSEQIIAGANVRRMHDKAVEYLTRVINDHPGTPWAYLAGVEMNDPLGWQWVEDQIPIPQVAMADNNDPGPQFAPEEEMRREQERVRQQKRNISRPKL